MVWNELRAGLEHALVAAGLDAGDRLERLELAIPRERTHGDWTTNLAMTLAKAVKQPPRAVAEAIARHFPLERSPFAKVEVAGPGFLNFRYADAWLAALPALIVAEGGRFGRSEAGAGEHVLVEFVSANPTGPMNIVSARAAAVGSALVRLLDHAGYVAGSEFYVNDAGNQVDLLGASLAARFAERIGATSANDLYPQLVAAVVIAVVGVVSSRWLREGPSGSIVPLMRTAFDMVAAGLSEDRTRTGRYKLKRKK